MNQLVIPHTGRKIYLPEDLSECDARQYIEMSALILRYQCQEITYEELRVQGFYKLIDMKRSGPSMYESDKFGNIYLLSQLLDSFFEELEVEGEKKRVIKQYYNHNPVPSFRGAWCHYYGPTQEFNNVKFGEYVDGLNHFIDFNDTGDTRYLYLLLATFYRPKKSFIGIRNWINAFDGDVRVKHNPATVERRMREFTKLHIGVVYGFYLLFASFQKYMTTCTVFIEGKEIDLSVLFNDKAPSSQKESDLPGIGMKSLMFSFADSGTFGPMDKLREVPLWEVLVRMYDLYKKNKDYEANQPKK